MPLVVIDKAINILYYLPVNIKNMTIHQLRLNGCKVRVNHKRYGKFGGGEYAKENPLVDMRVIRANKLQNGISAKGGQTTIELTKDGKNYTATAKCNPKDPFNRKIAIKICLGRIAKQVEISY